MKHQALFSIALFLVTVASTWADDWLRFRGPNGSGINPDGQTVPEKWDATTNLKWKVSLPGPGHSSPIVVGNQIFLTGWTGYGVDPDNPGEQKDLRLYLRAIDRKDGQTLWHAEIEPSLPETDFVGSITQHGYASHTPVSDGEKVFAFFGKTGVIAFDLNGKKLWQASVGNQLAEKNRGSAASPILFKNLLIINASAEAKALVALDKVTGDEVWKLSSEEMASTWTTPCLVTVGDRTDLVLSVPYKVWGIDPLTGKRLWYCDGSHDNTACSSVIVNGEIVYLTGGRGGGTIAVRGGGTHDVAKSHSLWESGRRGSSGSPIFHDGRLHWLHQGTAYCLDAATGKGVYRKRMISGAVSNVQDDYASPVVSGDKLYQLRRNGEMNVIQLGSEYLEISRNQLSDGGDFSATPALSRGDLFIRSTKFLYCIGKTK